MTTLSPWAVAELSPHSLSIVLPCYHIVNILYAAESLFYLMGRSSAGSLPYPLELQTIDYTVHLIFAAI